MTKKSDDACKTKLLELIKQYPGKEAAQIPTAFRRFLRPLEKQGLIECRKYGWYTKGKDA